MIKVDGLFYSLLMISRYWFLTIVKHFIAGASAGILGVIIWNFTLNNPGGFDGLIVGIFCNFFVFFIAYFIEGKKKGS